MNPEACRGAKKLWPAGSAEKQSCCARHSTTSDKGSLSTLLWYLPVWKDSALRKPRVNRTWRSNQFDSRTLSISARCQQCKWQNARQSCPACSGRACKKVRCKTTEWKILRGSCQERICLIVKNDKKKKTLIRMLAPTSTYEIEGRSNIATRGTHHFP